MPGAFGDPFRAIEALPGVMPLVSGLPYFFIRGAPPNDNGYYIDGVRVPLLFHVGIGQGVIHPGLIDRVDFFPGAAAGQLRRRRRRDHRRTDARAGAALHGEANLRLFDAGALVESPSADGRGSVLVAGRYGYPGPILGAITPGLDLGYWDYQARATWRLRRSGHARRLRVREPRLSGDAVAVGDPTARPIEQFCRIFTGSISATITRSRAGALRIALTGGHDRQGAAPTYVTDNSAAASAGGSGQGGRRRCAFAAGPACGSTRTASRRIRRGPGDPPVPSTADPPPTNLTGGAHADLVWVLGPRVELTPGVRFDLFASSRASAPGAATEVRTTMPAFDPRLSARVTLAPSIAWLSTLRHLAPVSRVARRQPPGAGR